MKDDNLYQKVKSAKKEARIAGAKYYKMELAMERELEATTRAIKKKYKPILEVLEKEFDEKRSKVWDIGGIRHDCGRFSTKNIVDIVAVLLTYIEGERYIPYRNWDNLKITEGSIIIKETVNKQYDKIDYPTLEMLYKNGDLIILERGFSNVVDFYDNIGDPNYYFGRFDYLREFVNRLIQYRLDNDKKDNMTKKELYLFMCSFISTHPELVQKNKDKREQMLMGEEDSLVSECKKLKEACSKQF